VYSCENRAIVLISDFHNFFFLRISPDPVDRPSFIDIGKSLDKMLMKG